MDLPAGHQQFLARLNPRQRQSSVYRNPTGRTTFVRRVLVSWAETQERMHELSGTRQRIERAMVGDDHWMCDSGSDVCLRAYRRVRCWLCRFNCRE